MIIELGIFVFGFCLCTGVFIIGLVSSRMMNGLGAIILTLIIWLMGFAGGIVIVSGFTKMIGG